MSSSEKEWARDPATLERILIATLAQRDWRGVEAAMTLLAFADPHRAQLLFDTMRVGLAWRRESDHE